ncbi:bifunctional glutamate N-acetyltransferase/amino-acid acetyltransferase ArgJ [Rhodobaculum claviforme]|uniref:Arginine biosynthesis bifunctional protein ArgJ n=1 Tax=Rhodobaculum claviforme TaxID=1549854 RepID=A0A934TJQ0_9RHOB|nr:bifunctional glutamate N-acetyltransferase/amino-acid acetyltransferase ArgJ [Rhodobaculum claviforme]MBK5927025.1 bifunctional ornithine acetyltransferase/N-acetylglutamate synthase [Rhodobaculum claviforme]
MAGKWKTAARKLEGEARKLRRKLKKARKALEFGPAVSPLAPARFPDLGTVAGVELATAATGVRYVGRDDLLVARLAPGTAVAGVVTRSATRSAAVLDVEAKLGLDPGDQPAAFVVNAGNSNAFTGAAGAAAVAAVAGAAADVLGVPEGRVFTASTGVIGEPLSPEPIVTALPGLTLAPGHFKAAAQAIRTTDTFAKGAVAEVDLDGGSARIVGIAKGSGMIAPDMATMLAFIFTDAGLPQPALARLVRRLADETFNRITVDGDTSTSDTVLVAATGAGPAVGDLRRAPGRAFEAGLRAVMQDLALQIVRDGEGARKLIEVSVTGAASEDDARRVARAIAESPLVKTAIAGEDANWGRIVMAVGKSGAQADRDRLTIRFGGITVAEGGARAAGYDEAEVSAGMRGDTVTVAVDLGLGPAAASMWTCDLTHGYIAINADYRS